MLEDAFFYAGSVEELTESLLDIFYKSMHEESSYLIKTDTRKFMEAIKEYLNRHMSEAITLRICRDVIIKKSIRYE